MISDSSDSTGGSDGGNSPARERDRAQQYLDIAGVMIVALDARAHVVLINRKGCEILGYEQAEILGKTWFEHFIPERHRPGVGELFARIMAGSLEMGEHAENPVLTRSGQERLIAWHNAMVRDDSGKIVGTLSSGMDITERAAAEYRLRESEERFRTTLYSIGDAVITTDREGRVQVMNPTAEALTGWTDTEARGKPAGEIFRIVSKEDRAAVESPVGRVLREGAVVGLGNHTLLVARDGTERPIADSGAPIRTESGETTGVVLVFRDQTEGRQAQANLAAAELAFRTFFDNAPIGKSMTAPDGKLLRVNRALCAMLGYTQDELQRVSWPSISHPDDEAATSEGVRSLLAGEREIWATEKRYLAKDGRIVWTHVTTALQRDAAGRPLHFLTHVFDITERKQADAALRASEEEFRAIFESNSSAMAIIERDTTISMVNREYCRVGGYQESDVIGVSWTSQIPPGDLERLQAYNRARLADPASAPDKYEFRFYRKDGEIRDCLMSVAMLPTSQKILASFVDVTERKRAQDDLARSSREWQRTFDASNDAIWILDQEQRVVRSNRTAERFFHRPCEELVGRHCWEIVHGTAEPITDCPILRTRRSLERETMELQLAERWLQVTVDPIVDSAGRYAGAVHVVSDITEHKREQQERDRLQASLAQSDRLASMGMLAAGVAHEINNPLAYVLYNVESLAQDLPRLAAAARRCGAALREHVSEAAYAEIAGDGVELLQPAAIDDAIDRAKEALSGARRIKGVARGLSTFSRVEQVERSRIDLRYPIESAINMAFNEIKYRARLVKDFGQVPRIWASEGKVAQIFLNLLINAAHAIDEGDVDRNRITIRTYAEGDDVLAEVADTGQGIPPEDLERIFDPFFTTKGVGRGSGLGLAICRNLVAELGGEIRVESDVGKGTRFVVRLPAKQSEREEQPADTVPQGTQIPSIRGRILVVDDDPPIRMALQRLLGPEHEVVVAASGKEGLGILERDRSFDLILCDLMMPEMTGMDLHAWLAARDPALARQVVFVTGGAFTPKASEYLGRVANLRIEKPFDADNLRKLVSTLIVAAKSQPPVGAGSADVDIRVARTPETTLRQEQTAKKGPP